MWRLLLVLMLCEPCSGLQIVFNGYAVNNDLERATRVADGYGIPFPDIVGQPFVLTLNSDTQRYHTDSRWYLHIIDITGGFDLKSGGSIKWRWEPYSSRIADSPNYNTVSLEIVDSFEQWNGDSLPTDMLYVGDRVYGDFYAQQYDSIGVHQFDWQYAGPTLDMRIGDVSGRMLDGESITDIPSMTFEGGINHCATCTGTTDFSTTGFRHVLFGLQVTSIRVVHDDLLPGDANVDGVFDQLDIVQALDAGRYQNGDRVSWAQGDWNADGLFNQLDLVAAQQASEYGTAYMAAMVPEPTSADILVVALFFGFNLFSRRSSHGRRGTT